MRAAGGGIARLSQMRREAQCVSIKFLIYIRDRARVYTKASRREGATPRNIESGAYDVNVARFRFRGPSAIHIHANNTRPKSRNTRRETHCRGK